MMQESCRWLLILIKKIKKCDGNMREEKTNRNVSQLTFRSFSQHVKTVYLEC